MKKSIYKVKKYGYIQILQIKIYHNLFKKFFVGAKFFSATVNGA